MLRYDLFEFPYWLRSRGLKFGNEFLPSDGTGQLI